MSYKCCGYTDEKEEKEEARRLELFNSRDKLRKKLLNTRLDRIHTVEELVAVVTLCSYGFHKTEEDTVEAERVARRF